MLVDQFLYFSIVGNRSTFGECAWFHSLFTPSIFTPFFCGRSVDCCCFLKILVSVMILLQVSTPKFKFKYFNGNIGASVYLLKLYKFSTICVIILMTVMCRVFKIVSLTLDKSNSILTEYNNILHGINFKDIEKFFYERVLFEIRLYCLDRFR